MEPAERLLIRSHGDRSLPALIYLPGIHGDWTLVTSFRLAVQGRVRFIEFTYPRTLSWTLEDYGRAVHDALLQEGIQSGWLLGESFGSQVGWALLADVRARGASFQPLGFVLAGGFGRHPMLWGVRLARFIFRQTPAWMGRIFLYFYRRYAWFRHRRAPETFESLEEFFSRRNRRDMEAIAHRLRLIHAFDPVPCMRETRLPVYYLSGWLDPIVPWPWVHPAIRKLCPGYQAGRIVGRADHCVLSTAPRTSADLVLDWMGVPEPGRSLRADVLPAGKLRSSER